MSISAKRYVRIESSEPTQEGARLPVPPNPYPRYDVTFNGVPVTFNGATITYGSRPNG